MKILFYGTDDQNGLCPSYMRAARQLDIAYQLFDHEKMIGRSIQRGKIGRIIYQFLRPENWVHKLNRHFVVTSLQEKPDVIISFTNAPVTPASLMFIKSAVPHCKLVLVWPDSLANFKQQTLLALPLYDFIATYGSTSVPILEKYAGVKAGFIPLAGDPELHGMEPQSEFNIDIGFVGGWRPERQLHLEVIRHHFPALRMGIHGPAWKQQCKKSNLRETILSEGLHGHAMAHFFNTTCVNINTIDDSNFPSANMRFFEIPTAGGLELSSACPEMEDIFRDRQDVLYFRDESSLLAQLEWILQHPDMAEEIRKNGRKKILQDHSYTQRLSQVLNSIG